MSPTVDRKRIALYSGPAAVTCAFLGILGAAVLAPSFSWTADALSDLGSRGAPTAVLFNGALVVAGLAGVPFAWRVWSAAETRVQRAGVAVLAVALVAMALVGVFPLPHAAHGPVAVAFFVLFTYGLVVHGTGDVLAGAVGRGLVSIWLGIAHPTAWLLWLLGDADGVAIPEFVGAGLLAGWVWLLFRSLRSNTVD